MAVKIFIPLLLFSLLTSCWQERENHVENEISIGIDTILSQKVTDSIAENTIDQDNIIESNDKKCPVLVLSATAHVDNYGTGKITIKYKNISEKTIEAVQFSYQKFNAFKEPVGKQYYSEHSKKMEVSNYGSVLIEKLVPAGETATRIVDVTGEDKSLKKLIADPAKVAFQDGEVWKSTFAMLSDL